VLPNGKRYNPARFLTRSVRKNEISETHEETDAEETTERQVTRGKDAAILRFHIPRGFIVGKNVFALM